NKITDATDFMGWYMDQSEQKLGISKWDATSQYLAYHEGQTGYSRGSHMKKAWLLRVAAEVGSRAENYQRQLIACGKL
ncbi:MAG: lytic transglycosylase, partial [Albidovulum sp.]